MISSAAEDSEEEDGREVTSTQESVRCESLELDNIVTARQADVDVFSLVESDLDNTGECLPSERCLGGGSPTDDTMVGVF